MAIAYMNSLVALSLGLQFGLPYNRLRLYNPSNLNSEKCIVDACLDKFFCHVVQWWSMPTHLQMPHRSKNYFLSSFPLSSGSLKG